MLQNELRLLACANVFICCRFSTRQCGTITATNSSACCGCLLACRKQDSALNAAIGGPADVHVHSQSRVNPFDLDLSLHRSVQQANWHQGTLLCCCMYTPLACFGSSSFCYNTATIAAIQQHLKQTTKTNVPAQCTPPTRCTPPTPNRHITLVQRPAAHIIADYNRNTCSCTSLYNPHPPLPQPYSAGTCQLSAHCLCLLTLQLLHGVQQLLLCGLHGVQQLLLCGLHSIQPLQDFCLHLPHLCKHVCCRGMVAALPATRCSTRLT